MIHFIEGYLTACVTLPILYLVCAALGTWNEEREREFRRYHRNRRS